MKILQSPLLRQYMITIIVNFGSLTTGISMAWSSPMIVKLYNGTDTPLLRSITHEEGSWIVSAGYLAATGTILLAGLLIDKIGRMYCIISVNILRICVSIWTIFVTEVWMLIFCRGVMVWSDCFNFMVVPVYVSEIASKEHRGPLGTFVHIISCLGMVVALAVGPFLTYTTFNVILATSIVMTSLPLPFLPDSPVYLHSKGNIDEAIKVLSKIRHSDDIIKQELKDYKSSQETKTEKIALLKNKIFLKSLFLGILVSSATNAIGYNAVLFYLQTVLDSSHTNVQPEIASVVIGCIQLFAAICSTYFTKVFGRRTLLIYSIAGIFFGMIGLGTFFKISTTEGYTVTGFLNYLPIMSLILCTYCFNVGIGYLPFIVAVELFDAPARAFGFSICITINLFLAFLITRYFAIMTLKLGPSETYWFFSVMCIVTGGLIALFLPETKGKTFNEIQISLGNKNINTDDKENQEY